MALVTLQAIEGLERGHVFQDLEPPVTIGREEDNTVRLNDERVSRFHAKIQEDQGRLIFTDLGSTNGSRVNGAPAQLHVLQVGDQIAIGRCLLILGNDTELAQLVGQRFSHSDELAEPGKLSENKTGSSADNASLTDKKSPGTKPPHTALSQFPVIPEGMSLLQKTQFSDYISHLHDELGQLILNGQEFSQRRSGKDESEGEEESRLRDEEAASSFMAMSWPHWQQLVQLDLQLARQLKDLADPEKQE